MLFLNKITAEAQQKFFLTGNVGQRIIMKLRYMPTQMLWLMDIEYGDFKTNGIAVTSSPNMLRNYKDLIPFGLACVTGDGLDPYYIDDFSSGRSAMYLLNAADVIEVEKTFQ